MGGIFLFFACFMIDYCAQMWHNIDTAKCADYAILQMYVQIWKHNGDGYFLKIE